MLSWAIRILIGLVSTALIAAGCSFWVMWHNAGTAIDRAEFTLRSDLSTNSIAFSTIKQVLSAPGSDKDRKLICRQFSDNTASSASDLATDALALDIAMHERPERTLKLALERSFIACRLERLYEPDELLAEWLERAYVGDGEYGVDMVSESEFGVPFDELGEEQAVMIAALIHSPVLRKDPEGWGSRAETLEARLNK